VFEREKKDTQDALFSNKNMFFWPRLNILIYLPISG